MNNDVAVAVLSIVLLSSLLRSATRSSLIQSFTVFSVLSESLSDSNPYLIILVFPSGRPLLRWPLVVVLWFAFSRAVATVRTVPVFTLAWCVFRLLLTFRQSFRWVWGFSVSPTTLLIHIRAIVSLFFPRWESLSCFAVFTVSVLSDCLLVRSFAWASVPRGSLSYLLLVDLFINTCRALFLILLLLPCSIVVRRVFSSRFCFVTSQTSWILLSRKLVRKCALGARSPSKEESWELSPLIGRHM